MHGVGLSTGKLPAQGIKVTAFSVSTWIFVRRGRDQCTEVKVVGKIKDLKVETIRDS